jgi:iron complex outermembrane recepter protein
MLNMKRLKILMMLMILTLACPGLLSAEEKEKDFGTYTLGEIVVSAERPVVKSIAVNTEITPEQIDATNARTVAEAVQFVPGIQVTTGRKNSPSISIHGFEQNKALILIDGVPYYETKYGMFDLNQVSTDSVAKIDIVKGAASVLYGANAEAGVINIITKIAGETPSFTGKLELGQNSYESISLSHGMKVGNINYWISYMHRDWDSWKLSDDFKPRTGVLQTGSGKTAQRVNTIIEDGDDRNNSDYKSDNLYFKVGLVPSKDSEYFINLHYIKTEKGDPPNLDLVTVFPNRPAFTQFDRITNYNDWGADLSGKTKLVDKLGLTVRLFYHHHYDDYDSYSDQTYATKLASSRYKDAILGGMIQGEYSIVDWNTIRLGVNYRKDAHEERDDTYLPFAKSNADTGSIGLEDEFKLMESKLSIVAGIGNDWFKVTKSTGNTTDSKTGDFTGQVSKSIPDKMNEINPMIGLDYKFDDTTKLFASVAKKTRFPTLNELYTSKGGNPDLTSEKSINFTIGASKSFNQTLNLELAPFYHDISDRISRDLPDPDPANLFHNSAKIKMKGFELNAEIYPMEDLSFKLGYTYNHAEDVSPGQLTDKVTNAPSQELNGQLQYIFSNWETRMNLTGVYYGKSYRQLPTAKNPTLAVIENDSYTVFGAKISQPFLEKWEAYVSVNNLFDKNYEPQSGYPAQGRNIWLGVAYKY